MKSRLLISANILLIALILIGTISADTLVAGKVLDSSMNPISNSLMTIQCDSHTLKTNSLSDGIYAVLFNVDSCASTTVTSDNSSAAIMKIVLYIPDDYTGGSGFGGVSHFSSAAISQLIEDNSEPNPLSPISAEAEESPEEQKEAGNFLTGFATWMGDQTALKAGAVILILAIIILVVAIILIRKKKSK